MIWVRIHVFTNQNQTFFPGGKINKKNTGFTYLRIYKSKSNIFPRVKFNRKNTEGNLQ